MLLGSTADERARPRPATCLGWLTSPPAPCPARPLRAQKLLISNQQVMDYCICERERFADKLDALTEELASERAGRKAAEGQVAGLREQLRAAEESKAAAVRRAALEAATAAALSEVEAAEAKKAERARVAAMARGKKLALEVERLE